MFPETDDEIKAFDTRFATEIEFFSNSLPDPLELLAKGRIEKEWIFNNEVDDSVKENLAQAAREGKKIPDAIKRKMTDDRKGTEKK
ncbi:MAG: hypothetical protein JWO58_2817 [Chitinophagaceae bacterium]|nr:hypothetical protein [Chitinophagaceae bacterium]